MSPLLGRFFAGARSTFPARLALRGGATLLTHFVGFSVALCRSDLLAAPGISRMILGSHSGGRAEVSWQARISHTASSRDAARNCPRSRSESERSADRRNKVKSTGDRRLAESPEGCPRHQRADRISRRAVPAELYENILSKGNSGRNEAGAGRSSRSEVETACSQSSPQGAEGGNSQQKRYEKCGQDTVFCARGLIVARAFIRLTVTVY
jgi:hypothetical protein